MKTSLPDVNLLFALLWPAHEGHSVAQSWFQRSGLKSWATNALTQLGLLRLLTNSVVTHGSVDASAAVDTLREATETRWTRILGADGRSSANSSLNCSGHLRLPSVDWCVSSEFGGRARGRARNIRRRNKRAHNPRVSR